METENKKKQKTQHQRCNQYVTCILSPFIGIVFLSEYTV
jgi:hypothetical protein